MISLPLHNLDINYNKDFQEFLKIALPLEKYFLIKNNNQMNVFRFEEQVKTYKEFFKLQGEIEEVKLLKVNQTYNVAPCNYCTSHDFITSDLLKVETRFYEQAFIEKLYLDTAKLLFKEKRIQRLLMISKDLLEHYNPESELAHFYLGFCFFSLGDHENLDQAILNVRKYDETLYSQLIKITKK